MPFDINQLISNFLSSLGYIKKEEHNIKLFDLMQDYHAKLNTLEKQKDGCIAERIVLERNLADYQGKASTFENQLIQAKKDLENSQDVQKDISLKYINNLEQLENLKRNPKIQYIEESECPIWLDENQPAYEPYIHLEQGEGLRINPRDVYTMSKTFVDWVYSEKSVSEINAMSKYDKAIYLWSKEVSARDYVMDKGDNWLSNYVTIKRKVCDCLPKDTYLLTSDGFLIEIKDINIGDEIIGYEGKPTKIINKWNKGILKTMKFHLSNKSILECTSEHKLFVIRHNQIMEILAKDLVIDDELLKFNKLNFTSENHTNKLELDTLKLYGYHIADGWVAFDGLNNFCISGKDGFKKEAQKVWVKEYCEKYNLSYRWDERYIAINNKELTKEMAKCGHTAINKNIPFSIALNEFEIIALLDGLKADAYLHEGNWIHRSISKKLITQIKLLYKQLGLQSSVKYFINHGGLGKNPIYDLTLRNNIYPIKIKEISEGREIECYDIETENKGIYLPESDIISHNCEDSTILFITSCMVAGFKPDEIFLAIGPTSFGYHAFPIIYFSAEEIPTGIAGWWIFESTLPSSFAGDIAKGNIKPKELKDSKYHVDTVANWNYAGVPHIDFSKEFNMTWG